MKLPDGYTERNGKTYDSLGNWVEEVDGKWLEVRTRAVLVGGVTMSIMTATATATIQVAATRSSRLPTNS